MLATARAVFADVSVDEFKQRLDGILINGVYPLLAVGLADYEMTTAEAPQIVRDAGLL
jgi:hypothetical protein